MFASFHVQWTVSSNSKRVQGATRRYERKYSAEIVYLAAERHPAVFAPCLSLRGTTHRPPIKFRFVGASNYGLVMSAIHGAPQFISSRCQWPLHCRPVCGRPDREEAEQATQPSRQNCGECREERSELASQGFPEKQEGILRLMATSWLSFVTDFPVL